MKEFTPELGAFTSYLLSIPETRIEAVLKGLAQERSLSTTVWESQTRNDGLAAWVNDWVIQDSCSRVRIGSNSKEWTNEDYVANNSTLYGSYAVYCRQSERSVKSLQNFSADLLELTNRTLGWGVAKAKVKINGKSTWVIKGVKLRSPHDNQPTVEEILEEFRLKGNGEREKRTADAEETSAYRRSKQEENQKNLSPLPINPYPSHNQGLLDKNRNGDNQGDNQGDNLKPLSDMDSDRGDNSFSKNKETKNNLTTPSDNLATVTPKEESNKNLQVNFAVEDAAAEASEEKALNDSDSVVTPVTPQSQQEVEPVTEVVTDPVTTPVTPKKEDINRKIDERPRADDRRLPSLALGKGTREFNWQSYPYNSSDVNTLKNRANKVSERILSCSTNNDLIKLLALHKASEPEIDWLVQNYLSSTERAQLEAIYKSTQGNLFNQTSSEVEIIEYTLEEIISAIDILMKRLSWTTEDGKEHLMKKYGKRSRLHLTDEQLLEFWHYLPNNSSNLE